MYLDPNDHLTTQIADTIMDSVRDQVYLNLINALKPIFSKDGNMYCYLYGELPNDCIIGFGETAALAMYDFYHNFYNEKVQKH